MNAARVQIPPSPPHEHRLKSEPSGFGHQPVSLYKPLFYAAFCRFSLPTVIGHNFRKNSKLIPKYLKVRLLNPLVQYAIIRNPFVCRHIRILLVPVSCILDTCAVAWNYKRSYNCQQRHGTPFQIDTWYDIILLSS